MERIIQLAVYYVVKVLKAAFAISGIYVVFAGLKELFSTVQFGASFVLCAVGLTMLGFIAVVQLRILIEDIRAGS